MTDKRRHGLSALAVVLCLLFVLSLVALFQHGISLQTLTEAHRAQLSALARTQAVSGLDEMLARVAHDLDDPSAPLFKRVREIIDDRFADADLTGLLPPVNRSIEVTWGRTAVTGPELVLAGRVLRTSVHLRQTRSSNDIQGSEEWVGLLDLTVEAEMSDQAGSVRRRITQSHEIRTVLISPPRPFDQMALFLGKMDGVTDPRAVNRIRSDLLRRQDDLHRKILDSPPPALSPEESGRLTRLAGSVLPADEVERRTPRLPEEPSVLWGFYGSEYKLADLDLAQRLVLLDERARAAEAEVEMSRARGSGVVDAIERLARAYSDALNAIWEYQRTLTIVPVSSDRHQRAVAPFLPRLTAAHFLDRAHLAFSINDPALQAWLAGRNRLSGVVDLRTVGGHLTLEGEIQGRVVLLIGPAGVTLENLNQRASRAGHRLVVVSLGGDVQVRGEAHAAVLMLPAESSGGTHGRFTLGAGDRLVGSLIVPEPAIGLLNLQGVLRYDPELFASYPPKKTLMRPYRGEYVVAVSPSPILADGGDR